MLVAGKSKSFNVSPTYNLKSDWKAALPVVDFHHKSEFHPYVSFSARALLRDGRHAKREFRTLQ